MHAKYFGTASAVGTNVGDIGLWDIGSKERLVLRNFKVWDLSSCSVPLQVCCSVNHDAFVYLGCRFFFLESLHQL